MIGFPSKAIEDGVSLRFFSVVLSRREAVLLRGGPRWKGWWIHHVHIFLCTSFPLAFGVSYVFLVYANIEGICPRSNNKVLYISLCHDKCLLFMLELY